MNITLITTFTPQSSENERIREEAKKLGHKLDILDFSNFNFSIKKHKLTVANLTASQGDTIIIRGILVAIKAIAAVLEQFRRHGVKIFDNNLFAHQYSIDKVADLVKLQLSGLPTPDTSYARSFTEYPKMAEELGYPLVIKSTRSGKGAAVFKIDTQEELGEFVKSHTLQGKEAKSYLLQEFIPYKHDLRILIIGERVFSMKRIPKEGEFRANFSLGGSVEKFELDEEGAKLAIKALAAVGLNVGGVDILETNDGKRFILEVNHTAGFVGMERATGENIAKIYLKYAIEMAR